VTKLSWDFDNDLGCEVATHNGYRIKAVRDDNASNPFEDWDGNWPIAIYYDGSIKVYEKTKGAPLRDVLSRFNDAQLVFNQKHIEKLLRAERIDLHMHGIDWDEDASPPKWVTDGAALRSWFEDAIGNEYDSKVLDIYEELYKLLGVPCYKTTSRGYCQGDWAEVLVVATPEAVAEFGCKEVAESDLEGTADLYSAWAWGDVFGYVIEKPVPAPAVNDEHGCCVECGRDNAGHEGEPCLYEGGNGEDCPMYDDGANVEWEDACAHNSCWGYYNDDHVKSGLEEAVLECVPDEPVRAPDNSELELGSA